MSKRRRVAITGVSVFLASTVAVACTSGRDALSPAGTTSAQDSVPHQDSVSQQKSAPHKDSVGGVPQLLACQTNHTAASGSQVIDWRGGTVVFGANQLVIPRWALEDPVLISATASGGHVVVVQFQPQGLEFEVSAQVILSYQGCALTGSTAHIDYVNDSLATVLEIEPSTIQTSTQVIVAPITHFSVYAVAE